MTVIDMESYRKRKKIKHNLNFESLENPYEINVKYGTGEFYLDEMESAINRLETEGLVHDSE